MHGDGRGLPQAQHVGLMSLSEACSLADCMKCDSIGMYLIAFLMSGAPTHSYPYNGIFHWHFRMSHGEQNYGKGERGCIGRSITGVISLPTRHVDCTKSGWNPSRCTATI